MLLSKENYDKPHCYQYDMRLKNLESDLREASLTSDEAKALRVHNFELKAIPKEDQITCRRISKFIEKHEWLGKMPHRPTHRFIALYRGHIAGVVVMATPNAFSNLLGRENRNLEKLIARGACISWSPKNLGSALIMFAVRWMAKNTSYRFFTAYSDTEARELGTIYQACNFSYLGTSFGARAEYFDPREPERGWFSDRMFRKTSQYKRYAERLGIGWLSEWSHRDKIFWNKTPEPVAAALKAEAYRYQNECKRRELPKKHKYVYILGESTRETNQLRAKFKELHPTLADLPYPKERGPEKSVGLSFEDVTRPTVFAAAPPRSETNISDGHLKLISADCRPHGHKKYLTVKEIAAMYGISDWTLYQFIKTDPSFPYLNVGLKKKFVIDEEAFRAWMEDRTKRARNQFFRLPSGKELLEKAVGVA